MKMKCFHYLQGFTVIIDVEFNFQCYLDIPTNYRNDTTSTSQSFNINKENDVFFTESYKSKQKNFQSKHNLAETDLSDSNDEN